MSRVMAVTFEQYGQLHYLDPGENSYAVGDWVLYPTENGPEVCRVVWAPEPSSEEPAAALPLCAGRADADALARDERNRAARAEAMAVSRELVARHGLAMKVVAVDLVDRAIDVDRMIAIYFSAPERVDFRALIPDLAKTLRARIDLRQVAARDATRLTSGIGQCGRELCCSTWLQTFEPISMRLARSQNMAGNPLQIQGQCGKLMCCLAYEHPLYAEFERNAPPIGDVVTTASGDGKVIGHSAPGQSVTVRLENGEVQRCPLTEVCPKSKARKERHSKIRRQADQP